MLRGKRVILRVMGKKDLMLVAQWRNDPRVQRSFFSPFLIHPAGQNQWHEDLQHDPTRLIFMIDTLEGQTVGMTGLDNIDRANQQAEMGFLLMDPDFDNDFHVSEANFLLTEYAFKEMNMRRIYAITFAERFKKEWFDISGYEQEIVLRQCVYIGGKFHDKIVWAVLREDWMEKMFGDMQPN